MNSHILRNPLRLVATAQAVYYCVTGLWPVISMSTFEMISGPKADRWLVRTVGWLLALIGGVLGLASGRGRVTPETTLLGMGAGVILACVDLVYAGRHRISKVYLLDALAEVVLLAGWVVALLRERTIDEKGSRS